jgi:hypothetical protein
MEILYCGQPIQDMTKDELLGVVSHVYEELERERNQHRLTLDTWRAFREAKKKLVGRLLGVEE